jgi:hypothetical protein
VAVLVTDPGTPIAPQIVAQHPDGMTVVTCDEPDAYMNAARHLREIGYRLAEDHGWVCVHASAATIGEHGVLIVGDSGAGKSSLALALATSPAGAFLSNDRTMIDIAPDGAARAVTMPGPIRVNGGTLRALGIEGARGWNLARPKPAPGTDWLTFHGASKLHILPGEWHERTGTPLAVQARIDLVVFPRITQDTDQLSLRGTSLRDARRLLAAQVKSPGDDVYVCDWLDVRRASTATLARHSEQVLDTLATRPSLEVRFGTGTLYGEVTAALSAALYEQAPRP